MIQKIIDYIANLFGLRKDKDKDKLDKEEQENKRNKPDDIYPLW